MGEFNQKSQNDNREASVHYYYFSKLISKTKSARSVHTFTDLLQKMTLHAGPNSQTKITKSNYLSIQIETQNTL